MSNVMKRREFLKLAGTAALAVSAAGILAGCGGGHGASGSDDLEANEELVLKVINKVRTEKGWDEAERVDELDALAQANLLENAKNDTAQLPYAGDIVTAADGSRYKIEAGQIITPWKFDEDGIREFIESILNGEYRRNSRYVGIYIYVTKKDGCPTYEAILASKA